MQDLETVLEYFELEYSEVQDLSENSAKIQWRLFSKSRIKVEVDKIEIHKIDKSPKCTKNDKIIKKSTAIETQNRQKLTLSTKIDKLQISSEVARIFRYFKNGTFIKDI